MANVRATRIAAHCAFHRSRHEPTVGYGSSERSILTQKTNPSAEVPLDRFFALDPSNSIETGFARIFLTEDEVYKLRKPVRLRFGQERVDLSTATARRAACLEELAVDERLSPGIARDVVPLSRDEESGRLFLDEEAGDPVDWALRMRRLPDAERATNRLAEGRLSDEDLRSVARHVARFHERARGCPMDPAAAIEQLRGWITIRIESPDVRRREPLPEEAARVEAWQLEFLDKERARFEKRAGSDAIRDGHGELTLDHVFIDDAGGVRTLAGLEIAPPFRNVDVAADVALLATDLESRGRTDLAERFLAEYAGLANDFDLYPLLDFHASLRAAIRAKLDWVCADHEHAGSAGEARYRERSRRFLALALARPRRPLLPPTVVAMGGQVASGKSTIAQHIARRIGAPVVGSDATRDFMIGGRLNEDLHEMRWEQSYESGFAERVYDEVDRRASEVLSSGRPVVVDGCFRSSDQRARPRALAERFGLPFLFVEAQVSREVQRARLAERAARDDVPIDDWQEIADQMRAQWESADELPAEERLVLDTSQPIEANAEVIEARLATWPPGMTG